MMNNLIHRLDWKLKTRIKWSTTIMFVGKIVLVTEESDDVTDNKTSKGAQQFLGPTETY